MTQCEFNTKSKCTLAAIQQEYWGNFIAIENLSSETRISRTLGTSNSLFYFFMNDGTAVFSSDLDIILKVISRNIRVDYSYLCSFLIHGSISTPQTPFLGVQELLHGCELVINPDSYKTQINWNPLDFISLPFDKEHTQASIAKCLRDICKTLTSENNNIFLELSGGLDSSSLLFFLKSELLKECDLTAINIYDPEDGSSNELSHAKQIAETMDTRLVAIDSSKFLPYSLLSQKGSNLGKPSIDLTNLALDAYIAKPIQKKKGICVSGHGGDHVFSCPPPIGSLADLVIDRREGFCKKIRELAVYYREPILPLLKLFFLDFLLYKFSLQNFHTKALDYQKAPWFKKDVYSLARDCKPHPFFYKNQTIPPGKLSQIRAIYDGLASAGSYMFNPNIPLNYPFFSQPLIEIALGIPTYESFSGSYDRILIRQAMANAFKTKAVWRKEKGGMTGTLQRGLIKNIKSITELCMNGVIANQGLLDKDILWKDLKKVELDCQSSSYCLNHLICIEIFMRQFG